MDQNNMVMNNVPNPNVNNNVQGGLNIPPEYKPLSMWEYFGYQLLFSIPCIGIIMLIVFAFGGTKNINLKNYAKSYFCVFFIVVAIAILGMICTMFIFPNIAG